MQVFPLLFNIGMVNNHIRVLFQMLPYREGGGLPMVGGWGSLMTHSAGSVTTQRIAFKYVMAFEPYSYR
jgi:hypothetical protein